MNHIKQAAVWLAIAFAAGIAAFYHSPSSAADVHVCTGIQDNARIVYDAVKENGPGAVPEIVNEIAELDEEVLNSAQARVLIQGAFALGLAAEMGASVPLKNFQNAAKEICEIRHGQTADRNNV